MGVWAAIAPYVYSMVAGLAVNYLSNQGSKGNRQESASPKLLDGQKPFLNLGKALSKTMRGAVPPAFLTGLGSLGEGAFTGYVPGMTEQLEAKLLPALERSYSRGEAAIREGAANIGALRSSSTIGEMADLRTGLESNLMNQLAGIEGALAQEGIGARLGASSTLAGLPNLAMPMGALASGIQYNQPQYGPSGKEKMGAFAGPILGSLAGNPNLFKGSGGGAAAGGGGGK